MAQDIQPVVEGHDDHVMSAGQGPSVVRRPFLAVPAVESAAVEPDHDRPFAAVIDPWRPDIQAEAVFIRETVVPSRGKGLFVVVPAGPFALRAGRPVGAAAPDAFPGDVLGGHEPLRLAVGNAFVDVDAVFHVAGDVAAGRRDAGSRFGGIEPDGRNGFLGVTGCQQQCRGKE